MPEKKSETKAASKPVKVKVPNVYAFIFYGGQVIKSGVGLIKVTDEHPEVEFNNYKNPYGDELKGRWVKCTIPIDTVRALVLQELNEKKIGENLFKIDTTKAVEIIKKATGATKSTTIGVYSTKKASNEGGKKKEGSDDEEDNEDEDENEDEEDDEEAPKSKTKKSAKADEAPKSKTKKSVKVEDEEPKKVKAKDVKKATVEPDDEEEEEPKAKNKSKDTKEVSKKLSKKPTKIDSEDESQAPKKSNNKQIVLSSDSEDEEED